MMRFTAKKAFKLISTLLVLCLTFIGFQSFAAKKYMISFKDSQSFQHIKQQAKVSPFGHSSGSQFFAAGSKVKALDNLDIFVVETEDDLSHLANHPNILSVEEDIIFPLPDQVATFSKRALGAFSSLSVERPWGIDAVNAPAAWATTQGKGVKVLIVDTGVDRDHPALKDRFIEGRNFYPRNSNKPGPTYDYFDDIGHGTHVAGTVLGDIVGVAPEAEFYAGRVCGQLGCSSVAIVDAVNWGIDEGVDVMNLSLGGPRTTATQRKVFARAESMGVTVVAASGNSAGQSSAKDKNGNDIISFPAGIDSVIAVGAVSEDLKRASFSQFGPGLFVMAPGVNVNSAVPMGSGRSSTTMINLGDGPMEVPSTSFQGSSSPDQAIVGELVYVGLGKKDDYQGKDLTGKVALIKRGEIAFGDKVRGAMAVGAKAAVIFNNIDGLASGSLTQDGSEIGVPVVMVELEQGEKILKVIADKSGTPEASVMINKTDYAPLQGTSMASPHVCGVVALIVGANPNLSPEQIRQVLANSATDVGSTLEYGNGMVNSEEAVAKAVTMVGEKFLQPALALAN